jgi:signal peptidase I
VGTAVDDRDPSRLARRRARADPATRKALRQRRKRQLAVLALVLLLGAWLTVHLTGQRVHTMADQSMRPTIRAGDLVVTRGVQAADLAAGDVITYVDPTLGIQVTQRVTAVDRRAGELTVTTAGDSYTVSEPWRAEQSTALRRYVTRVPGLGYVTDALATMRVPLAVVVVLALVVRRRVR